MTAPHPRCAICRADLATRPVMREVRNGHLRVDGTRAGTYGKRVHMKPAQVVIACRTEGSFGAENLPAELERWEVRVCVECLKGREWHEVLAVWLDRRLESPGVVEVRY